MGRTVIVGAGQAGCSLAVKLREQGSTDEILMLGEETDPPYQRPPLSKSYLMGEMVRERLYLRKENFFAEQEIELRTNARVTKINPSEKVIDIGDSQLGYDELILTTGSEPIRLPAAAGGDLANVYSVRTLMDIDSMAHEFRPGRRLLVIGGGYIGLEVAAVAAKLGIQVTLVELASRILARVAAPETADYFRNLHQQNGVDLREGVGVERLLGGSTVSQALLTDGSELDINFVVAGIGVRPSTGLAELAGLKVENGIWTDAMGRTSVPNIWAAGDCASFPYRGTQCRLESVPNAIDQAETVAKNLMGHEVAYHARPWFWSDQYDVKLQIAGLNTGYDRVVARPGQRPESQSNWYFKGNDLLSVDAMNDPKAYLVAKKVLDNGRNVSPADVANTGLELKQLLVAGV